MLKSNAKFSLLLALCVFASTSSILAQSNNSKERAEQALRELIKQSEERKVNVKTTDDFIFNSAAVPHATIGRAQYNEVRQQVLKKNPVSNQKQSREVKKLVVSESGDMAYEFGNWSVSHDNADKKRINLDGTYLRVWQNINNEWKVAAYFARTDEK